MSGDHGTGRAFTEESEAVPPATITLVEGTSFAICDATGDVAEGSVEGIFVGDTRICSRLTLRVDGSTLEPLTVARRTPFDAVFVSRSRDRSLLVYRELRVGDGVRLDLTVRNLTPDRRELDLAVAVRADLADLFAVKEGRAGGGSVPWRAEGPQLTFSGADGRRGLRVRGAAGAVADQERGELCWQLAIDGREEWHGCIEVVALRAEEEVEPKYRCGVPPAEAVPAARQARWHERAPSLETDVPGLAVAFSSATDDLGALRLFDPEHPDEPLVAAGAPWFMTLFGRDSIFASWMALPLDPHLALSTARTLARLQGTKDDPRTEEQPGRILHEVRASAGRSLALSDGDIYYGTADATPLFVMLVHELWRWGTPFEELADLLPAVDAALGWLAGPGDPDGDGYVEYAPRSPGSLANQGWKDSFDAISHRDGRLAEGPIAVAEVQAYAYAAWKAGSDLARAAGDEQAAGARLARAEALQASFERDFWLPDVGAFALALDGDKRPVDSVASNMGHCLWAGIVRDPEQRAAVARWLTSPELFTGWGVRTLATSMARYNPLSYHNGSVWPHDTAVCVAGLRRAGFAAEAVRLGSALLSAAGVLGGRLPELFAGITAEEVPAPVPYPASCSPQAWAAASPLLVVRALLGLEPDLPAGLVELDPVLPSGSRRLRLVDMPLAGSSIEIEVDGDSLAVRGLPPGVMVVRRAS